MLSPLPRAVPSSVGAPSAYYRHQIPPPQVGSSASQGNSTSAAPLRSQMPPLAVSIVVRNGREPLREHSVSTSSSLLNLGLQAAAVLRLSILLPRWMMTRHQRPLHLHQCSATGARTRDDHPQRCCHRSVSHCCVLRPAALLLSSLPMSSRSYAATTHGTSGVRTPRMALLPHNSSRRRCKQQLRRKSLEEEDVDCST